MNTQKIILFSIVVSGISFDTFSTGVGSDHGLNAARVIAPVINAASEKVNEAARDLGIKAIKEISPHLKEFVSKIPDLGAQVGLEGIKVLTPSIQDLAKSMPQASADFGKNFGLETTKAVGGGIMLAGTKAKAAVIAAKKAAVIIASSPAAPYVAIGVGVIVVSYGGYKVYRYYHPTEEQIAAAKKLQIEIQKSQAKLCKIQHAAEINKKEAELKEALIKHSADQCTEHGIPLSCQKEALAFALVAGNKKVEKIVDAFTKYKPQQERWA